MSIPASSGASPNAGVHPGIVVGAIAVVVFGAAGEEAMPRLRHDQRDRRHREEGRGQRRGGDKVRVDNGRLVRP